MRAEQDDLVGLLAASDLGDDVARLPGSADLVADVERDARRGSRLEEPCQAQAVLARELRHRDRRDRTPGDRVAVQQVPRPRRGEEDRRHPVVHGRLHRLGAELVLGEEVVERHHRLRVHERDRALAPSPRAGRSPRGARPPRPRGRPSTGPGVEGASPSETTRIGNSPGETTAAVAEIPSQLAGTGYDSSFTESTPARRNAVDAPLQGLLVPGAARHAAADLVGQDAQVRLEARGGSRQPLDQDVASCASAAAGRARARDRTRPSVPLACASSGGLSSLSARPPEREAAPARRERRSPRGLVLERGCRRSSTSPGRPEDRPAATRRTPCRTSGTPTGAEFPSLLDLLCPRRLALLEKRRQAFLRFRRGAPLRDRARRSAASPRRDSSPRPARSASWPRRRPRAPRPAATRPCAAPPLRARPPRRPGARGRCGAPRARRTGRPSERGRAPSRGPIARSTYGEMTAGRMPSLTSASEKTVPSAAIAMSAAATSPTPPPIAAPCASATTGFGHASIARSIRAIFCASASFSARE